MNCTEYSHNLELVGSLDDTDPDLRETIEHIKGCPECREIFTASKELDNVIHEKMQDVEVPPYLLNKVKANLAPSRVTPSPFPFSWSMVWVLTVLVFVSSLVSSVIYYNQLKIMARLDNLSSSSPAPVQLAATAPTASMVEIKDKNFEEKAVTVADSYDEKEPMDTSHNAIFQLIAINAVKRHKNILKSKFVVFDNNEVNDEFKKRFKFPITLPDFSDDLKLVGGSKCHSCSYEMAYLLYRDGREGVSLCVFPASNFGLEKWSGVPETVRKKGYNVAMWKKKDNVYVMVFKMSVSEARTIVYDLKKK